MITAKELRQKYLEFFQEKGHKVIPSASLIPEHDPTVLFTTAGMHPLVPYLLGEKHPAGKRLASVQKCLRTGDIEQVGDNTHLTFFEMLGNWSLGDYFKKEAIEWSWEFLTSPRWLNLDKKRLAISVFAGDENAPFDQEAYEIWSQLGVPDSRIARLSKEDNWWGPAGATGPTGPDTEMFYWVGREAAPKVFDPKDARWVEIWNDVFMQYNKTAEGKYEPLVQKNVDTGMGLERTLAALNGKESVFDTELFIPLFDQLQSLSKKKYQDHKREFRIIADHLKAATFILGDPKGVTPSNVDQGYVLRRLIRRAIRYGQMIELKEIFIFKIAEGVIKLYEQAYPELRDNRDLIINQLVKEEERFKEGLAEGIKRSQKIFFQKTPIKEGLFYKIMLSADKKEILKEIFEKKRSGGDYRKELAKLGADISLKEFEAAVIDGHEAFDLYQTYGFPIEMIIELAQAKHLLVDVAVFREELQRHQEVSRRGAEKKFKGGLADTSEQSTRYHTATHLLHQALRDVLGPQVLQRGSNITVERLRFDFAYDKKMTPEEIKKVEAIVNQKIKERLPVFMTETTPAEAKKFGAIGLFGEKYGERVKVYSIGGPIDSPQAYSKEFCGGPHVKNTGELGHFKIIKEEASSAGVRRIKAILE